MLLRSEELNSPGNTRGSKCPWAYLLLQPLEKETARFCVLRSALTLTALAFNLGLCNVDQVCMVRHSWIYSDVKLICACSDWDEVQEPLSQLGTLSTCWLLRPCAQLRAGRGKFSPCLMRHSPAFTKGTSTFLISNPRLVLDQIAICGDSRQPQHPAATSSGCFSFRDFFCEWALFLTL